MKNRESNAVKVMTEQYLYEFVNYSFKNRLKVLACRYSHVSSLLVNASCTDAFTNFQMITLT